MIADLSSQSMAKIQVEYGYNRLGSRDLAPGGASTLPSGIISSIPLSAKHSMHDADFNHQIVNVTTPSVGLATVCDPWIYVCYPVAVPVTQIIGERSNTAFGWNLGSGVTSSGNYFPFTFGFRFHSAD